MISKALKIAYTAHQNDLIDRHNQRKNERKMVAATMRKIQAPNQEAAVFEVSGSPEENFE